MIWYFRFNGMEQAQEQLDIICYERNYHLVQTDKETAVKLHALFGPNTESRKKYSMQFKKIRDLLIAKKIKQLAYGGQTIDYDFSEKQIRLRDYKLHMIIYFYHDSRNMEIENYLLDNDYNTFNIKPLKEALEKYTEQKQIPKLKFTQEQINKFKQYQSNGNINQVNNLNINFSDILEVDEDNKEIIEKYLKTQINYIVKICQLLDKNQFLLMLHYTYLNGVEFYLLNGVFYVSITNYISLLIDTKNINTKNNVLANYENEYMVGNAFDRVNWKKMYNRVSTWIKTRQHPDEQQDISEEEQKQQQNNQQQLLQQLLQQQQINQQQPQFPLQQQQNNNYKQHLIQNEERERKKALLKKLGYVSLLVLFMVGLYVLVKYNKKRL